MSLFHTTKKRGVIGRMVIFVVLASFVGSAMPFFQRADAQDTPAVRFLDSDLNKQGAFAPAVRLSPPTVSGNLNIQPPASAGFPVADIGKAIWDFIRAIGETFTERFKTSLDLAYKNALRSFAQRGAYALAIKLAGGGTGKQELFVKNWNLGDEFDAAVGDFLNNSLGQAWGKNLCDPLDPLLKVNLEIAARQILEPPKPRCTLYQIRQNLNALGQQQFFGEIIDLPSLGDMFNPEGNDLGILLTVTSGALSAGQLAQDTELNKRLTEGPFKSIVDPVTGQVRTPAGIVESAARKYLIEAPFDVETVRSDNPLVNAADLFISTFINTFAGNLFRKWSEEGLHKPPPRTTDIAGFGAVQAARQKFADILEVKTQSGGPAQVLAQLEACDTVSGQQAFAKNCVLDAAFSAAVREQKTVAQAVKDGDIQGGWAFGQLGDGKGAYSDLSEISRGLFSLRNISIMRMYGIVPSGWEVAARYIVEVQRRKPNGQAWTLNDLMSKDHFNNPSSPFYRLVDKQWVFKVPDVFARRRGAGPLISHYQPVPTGDGAEVRDVPVRLDYNADEQTCILEGDQGCVQFGYCTEYRNTWKISDAKVCNEEWVSCQSYVAPNGSSVTYLSNSIDKGEAPRACGAGNVGCSWYCLAYNSAQGSWLCRDETTRMSASVCTAAGGCACTVGGENCTVSQGGSSCTTASGAVCLNAPSSSPGDYIRLNQSAVARNNSCQQGAQGCTRLWILRDPATGDLLDAAAAASRIGEVAAGQAANTTPRNYNELSGVAVEERRMKIAPDYYGCDDPATRASECSRFAARCTEAEIACDRYTPIDSRDGVPVPAIINPATDQCSPACVGYSTFWEQPTFFDDQSSFFASNQHDFIPERQYARQQQRGLSCDASVAGCEEFTNLNIPGTGGEAREYYYEFQSCTTGGAEVYYSWQGSDSDAQQLRVWRVLPSNADAGPCTNGLGDAASAGCYDNAVPPRSAPGTPPLAQALCGPETLDPNDDPGINPDCVQFIDTSLNTYWRLASRVVVESAECVPLRRAVDGTVWNMAPGTGKQCSAANAGCRAYQTNASFDFRLIPLGDTAGREDFSDRDVNGWEGAGASGLPTIIPSNESPLAATSRGGSGEWSGGNRTWLADLGTGVTCNDPAGCPASNAADPSLTCMVPFGQSQCGLLFREMEQGSRYVLSFWAKSSGAAPVTFDADIIEAAGNISIASGVSIGTDWQMYQYGPIEYDRVPSPQARMRMSVTGGSAYITNIELRESTEIYVIKETPWDVGSCTAAEIGCIGYTDRSGAEWYLNNFSTMCRDEAVGCTRFIDTKNSTAAALQTFAGLNADAGDDVVVPADTVEYFVDSPGASCSALDVGCTMVGLAVVGASNVPSFATGYIRLNADNFGTMVCHAEELQCQEFRLDNEKKGLAYFKDPGERVCVRTEPNQPVSYCALSGKACSTATDCPGTGNSCIRGVIDGWIVKGTGDVCQTSASAVCKADAAGNLTAGCFVPVCDPLDSTANRNAYRAVDPATGLSRYGGCYVRGCDNNLSSCTAYRDPLDPPQCNQNCPLTVDPATGEPIPVSSTCETTCTGPSSTCIPGCQTYYMLADSVDAVSCAGTGIDPSEGCVPFYDVLGPAPSVVSECWAGCPYEEDASGNPQLVDDNCTPVASVGDGGRPGCSGLLPR